MTRKSIESRMDRIMDRLLPPGSMAAREYGLPEHLRDLLDHHRRRTDEIISRCQKIGGAGEFYRRMIEGEIDPPQMPPELADALGVTVDPLANVSADATTEELAELYNRMIEGDEQ